MAKAKKSKSKSECKWFLLCPEPATTKVEHPVLGDVPCCASCAAFARGE